MSRAHRSENRRRKVGEGGNFPTAVVDSVDVTDGASAVVVENDFCQKASPLTLAHGCGQLRRRCVVGRRPQLLAERLGVLGQLRFRHRLEEQRRRGAGEGGEERRASRSSSRRRREKKEVEVAAARSCPAGGAADAGAEPEARYDPGAGLGAVAEEVDVLEEQRLQHLQLLIAAVQAHRLRAQLRPMDRLFWGGGRSRKENAEGN